MSGSDHERLFRERRDLFERVDELQGWLRRAPMPPPPPLRRALGRLTLRLLNRLPSSGAGCASCPRQASCGGACHGEGEASGAADELHRHAAELDRAFESAGREGGAARWEEVAAALERLRARLHAELAARRPALARAHPLFGVGGGAR